MSVIYATGNSEISTPWKGYKTSKHTGQTNLFQCFSCKEQLKRKDHFNAHVANCAFAGNCDCKRKRSSVTNDDKIFKKSKLNFVCDVCNTSFSTKIKYFRHMN